MVAIDNIETYDLHMYMSDCCSGEFRETRVYARAADSKSLLATKHRLIAIVEESQDSIFLYQLLNSIKTCL